MLYTSGTKPLVTFVCRRFSADLWQGTVSGYMKKATTR
jgi:hypothetical protein